MAAYAVEVRRSRFLADAVPVDPAADALAWLASVQDVAATHTAGRGGSVAITAAATTAHRQALPGARDPWPGLRPGRGAGHALAWRIKLGAGGLVRAYWVPRPHACTTPPRR